MPAAQTLYVARSGIDGRGCFAATRFRRMRKVAELTGERISRAESRRRIAHLRRIRICDVDEWTAIDASRGGNATAFINHSCDPNLFTRTVCGHVLFFALRDISAGEELSIDYGPSHHDGRKACYCGAPRCRGTL
jgi:SET domain-containing protein